MDMPSDKSSPATSIDSSNVESESTQETQEILHLLKEISYEYDQLNQKIQEKISTAFQKNKDKTFRDIQNAQLEIRVSSEGLKPIYKSIYRFDQQFSELDRESIQVEKLFERNSGLFRNTILDIAIHTLGDCHHMSDDPRIRELLIFYEKIVILPLAKLYMIHDMSFTLFGRITLNEENMEMEYWNRFGDEKPIGRGVYQTFGSLLRNGFFLTVLEVLEHRKQCYAFEIPPVFLGNVIGWLYHKKITEDEQFLLAILHSLSKQQYRPSPGVRKVIDQLGKNLERVCPLDRIEDWNLLPCDNLLEDVLLPTNEEKEYRRYILNRVHLLFGTSAPAPAPAPA